MKEEEKKIYQQKQPDWLWSQSEFQFLREEEKKINNKNIKATEKKPQH